MSESQDFSLYEPMTTRESDILALLAENLSDREIAERLMLGHNTVKWYNRQIFQKLGVENRRQAAKRAAALGLFNTRKPAEAVVHNLPAVLTPFVGRIEEQEEIGRLLGEAQPRLLTLLGPGGMGKTRLALAVSLPALTQFSGGVFFVSLAPLTSPDQLVTAIGEAVGCPSFMDDRAPLQRLCDYLRQKYVLLVLDNFDHLLDGTRVVTAILQAAPHVRMIATSRERLNVSGEMAYPLNGLRYPETMDADNAREYGAVQLFIQSAQRAQPHFSAPDADIVRICQLVQGMPLAIELAAAWTATLTAEEIAAEIARSADFLRTTLRDVPERLRSVRTVFEAAWDRLSEEEKRSYAALSVFRGGFMRDAAQAVAGAGHLVLAALLDRALLWRHPEMGRYYIHELLRQYAEERLEQSGEQARIRQAHRDYFRSQTAAGVKAIKVSGQLQALAAMDLELDNIRLALEDAIEDGTPAMLEPFADLGHYFDIRGMWIECEHTFGRAIAKLEPHDSIALAKFLMQRSLVSIRLVREEFTKLSPNRSVEMLRRLSADHELPLPMMILGWSFAMVHDVASSIATFREGLEIARRNNDVWSTACLLHMLGLCAQLQGNLAEAKGLVSQGYQLMMQLENVWGQCNGLSVLGGIALLAGEYEEARKLYDQALLYAKIIRNPQIMIEAYVGLSLVAQEIEDWENALRLGQTVLQLRRDAGQYKTVFPTLTFMADITIELGDISDARRYLREALASSKDAHEGMRLYFLMISAKLLIRTGYTPHACQFLMLIRARSARQKWVAYGSDHFDLETRDIQVVDELMQACQQVVVGQRTDLTGQAEGMTIDKALELAAALL